MTTNKYTWLKTWNQKHIIRFPIFCAIAVAVVFSLIALLDAVPERYFSGACAHTSSIILATTVMICLAANWQRLRVSLDELKAMGVPLAIICCTPLLLIFIFFCTNLYSYELFGIPALTDSRYCYSGGSIMFESAFYFFIFYALTC